MRVLIIVQQPCVLCEDTICSDTLYRDTDTGEERWEREYLGVSHECEPMRLLRQERVRAQTF